MAHFSQGQVGLFDRDEAQFDLLCVFCLGLLELDLSDAFLNDLLKTIDEAEFKDAIGKVRAVYEESLDYQVAKSVHSGDHSAVLQLV